MGGVINKAKKIGGDALNVVKGIPGTVFNDTEETQWKSTNPQANQTSNDQRQGAASIPMAGQRFQIGDRPQLNFTPRHNEPTYPVGGVYYMRQGPMVQQQQPMMQEAINNLRFG